MIIILTLLALACFTYFVIIGTAPLADMIRNRLLYRLHLTRAEQAVVERKLSRLARVIVLCDRVDRPTSGFLDAVKDNFSTNVRYLFLVSSKSTAQDIDTYKEVFEHIQISVREERKARAVIDPSFATEESELFEIHRLEQEWNDYPYICYEFLSADTDDPSRFLMYRGNQLGVGIAEEYVRISPETAYSLVKRADALKHYIGADRNRFSDGREGSLANLPIESNVIPMRVSGNG